MNSQRSARLGAIVTVAMVLAGCGTGASSYTPAGGTTSSQGQAASGAGQSSGSSATTAPAASGDKVHLVYFNARMGEPAERALVARYMKDHPNIDIEYLST